MASKSVSENEKLFLGNEIGKSVIDEKMYARKEDDSDNDKASEYNSHHPLFTIDVGDGIGTVNNVIIDSGSHRSIIRKDMLPESISSTMKKTAATAKLSDESITKFLGRVNLNVTYQGSAVEIDFYVTDEFICPMLLGVNWIIKSRAILQSDGTEFGVTFGGKKEKVWFSKWFCFRPHVTVNVDGVGLVKALVDTGASDSWIRGDLLTGLQLSKAVPSSNMVVASNEKQIKIDGLLSLNVAHHGINTCIEKVYIDSNMSDPLILGMDWIKKTRVMIKSDGWKLIALQPDLPPKKKKIDCLKNWLSKKWSSSTFGSAMWIIRRSLIGYCNRLPMP